MDLGTGPTQNLLIDPQWHHLAQSNWLKKEKKKSVLKLTFTLHRLL